MDPTGVDPVARWLAYGHPLFMLTSLAFALLTLRAGLGLHRARASGLPMEPAHLRRHVRLGKLAVTMILVGFCGGPISMWLLRGRAPFETAHSAVGLTTATLFIVVALLGRRLETGRGRPVAAHRILALIAVLAAAAAFATGFVLLP